MAKYRAVWSCWVIMSFTDGKVSGSVIMLGYYVFCRWQSIGRCDHVGLLCLLQMAKCRAVWSCWGIMSFTVDGKVSDGVIMLGYYVFYRWQSIGRCDHVGLLCLLQMAKYRAVWSCWVITGMSFTDGKVSGGVIMLGYYAFYRWQSIGWCDHVGLLCLLQMAKYRAVWSCWVIMYFTDGKVSGGVIMLGYYVFYRWQSIGRCDHVGLLCLLQMAKYRAVWSCWGIMSFSDGKVSGGVIMLGYYVFYRWQSIGRCDHVGVLCLLQSMAKYWAVWPCWVFMSFTGGKVSGSVTMLGFYVFYRWQSIGWCDHVGVLCLLQSMAKYRAVWSCWVIMSFADGKVTGGVIMLGYYVFYRWQSIGRCDHVGLLCLLQMARYRAVWSCWVIMSFTDGKVSGGVIMLGYYVFCRWQSIGRCDHVGLLCLLQMAKYRAVWSCWGIMSFTVDGKVSGGVIMLGYYVFCRWQGIGRCDHVGLLCLLQMAKYRAMWPCWVFMSFTDGKVSGGVIMLGYYVFCRWQGIGRCDHVGLLCLLQMAKYRAMWPCWVFMSFTDGKVSGGVIMLGYYVFCRWQSIGRCDHVGLLCLLQMAKYRAVWSCWVIMSFTDGKVSGDVIMLGYYVFYSRWQSIGWCDHVGLLCLLQSMAKYRAVWSCWVIMSFADGKVSGGVIMLGYYVFYSRWQSIGRCDHVGLLCLLQMAKYRAVWSCWVIMSFTDGKVSGGVIMLGYYVFYRWQSIGRCDHVGFLCLLQMARYRAVWSCWVIMSFTDGKVSGGVIMLGYYVFYRWQSIGRCDHVGVLCLLQIAKYRVVWSCWVIMSFTDGKVSGGVIMLGYYVFYRWQSIGRCDHVGLLCLLQMAKCRVVWSCWVIMSFTDGKVSGGVIMLGYYVFCRLKYRVVWSCWVITGMSFTVDGKVSGGVIMLGYYVFYRWQSIGRCDHVGLLCLLQMAKYRAVWSCWGIMSFTVDGKVSGGVTMLGFYVFYRWQSIGRCDHVGLLCLLQMAKYRAVWSCWVIMNPTSTGAMTPIRLVAF